jgi:carbamoylphosphate synthase large subunit
VNIQYLIFGGELYVIEVNPRASRTVPYISKVTGVQMVDIASRVMLGAKLSDMGCGTGLYRTPPYTAVKVPVFSFEKLSDANSILGPEMKSTGEALGLGRTMAEALYKGLTAAGFAVPAPNGRQKPRRAHQRGGKRLSGDTVPGKAVFGHGHGRVRHHRHRRRHRQEWAWRSTPWRTPTRTTTS